MDFELARFNMIEQQIRTWEVLDPAVLDLLKQVPREDFVPAAYRSLAFADIAIPLGHGEVMMEPKVEARLLQALNVSAMDKVLEVGTGSGYFTALLARAGKHVTSVEIREPFSTAAQAKLAAHGIGNVTLECGDAAQGWGTGTYEVIAITGAVPAVASSFIAALAPGGRLVALLGEGPVQEAVVIKRAMHSEAYTRESLFETYVPLLTNARQIQFVF